LPAVDWFILHTQLAAAAAAPLSFRGPASLQFQVNSNLIRQIFLRGRNDETNSWYYVVPYVRYMVVKVAII
jgi:hypothetical protein